MIGNAAVSIVYKFSVDFVFSILLVPYLGVDLLNPLITLFNLLRNYQTVF